MSTPVSIRPRIAFMTGQSDPGRCALSPVQRATLDALVAQADRIDPVAQNFPWHDDSAPWRPVPLLRASLVNGRQYLAARRGALHALSPAQCDAARARLLDAPRTLLLAGSCGLALLDALCAPFDATQRARLRIIAYGAVGPRWPRGIDGLQLRGERDRIAVHFGPTDGPPPRTLACGHIDYLDSDASRAVVIAAACEQLGWLQGDA